VNNSNSIQRHIVYKSNNIFIKIVGRLFFRKIDDILKSFQAQNKFGIDLGCGESHLLSILSENKTVGAIVAYDISTENLRNAKLRYPEFVYVQGDAHFIAFRNRTFDYVIALEILEHVGSPENVLNEIHRIAKPDAKVVISVPNEPFFHLGNILRGKYIKRFGKTPNHLSYWNARQFKELLIKKFIINQSFYISVFPWQLYICSPSKLQT